MARACGADDIKNMLYPALVQKTTFSDDRCHASQYEEASFLNPAMPTR
jgi:hypothetical protein